MNSLEKAIADEIISLFVASHLTGFYMLIEIVYLNLGLLSKSSSLSVSIFPNK